MSARGSLAAAAAGGALAHTRAPPAPPEEEISKLLHDQDTLRTAIETRRIGDIELTANEVEALKSILTADEMAPPTTQEDEPDAEVGEPKRSGRLVKIRPAAEDPAVLLSYSKLPFTVRRLLLADV